MVKSIEWVDGKVIMLDQSKLPFEVTYITCTDYLMVAEGIRKLRIRGAPAIGIAAAMGIALAAQDIHAMNSAQFMKAIEPVFHEMLSTRPTAVNISWAVERLKRVIKINRDESVSGLKQILIREAQSMLDEDITANKA